MWFFFVFLALLMSRCHSHDTTAPMPPSWVTLLSPGPLGSVLFLSWPCVPEAPPRCPPSSPCLSGAMFCTLLPLSCLQPWLHQGPGLHGNASMAPGTHSHSIDQKVNSDSSSPCLWTPRTLDKCPTVICSVPPWHPPCCTAESDPHVLMPSSLRSGPPYTSQVALSLLTMSTKPLPGHLPSPGLCQPGVQLSARSFH